MALSCDGRYAFTAGGQDRSVIQWEINLRYVTGRGARSLQQGVKCRSFFPLSSSGRCSALTTCQAPCSACGYRDEPRLRPCPQVAPHDTRSRRYGDGMLLSSRGPMVFAVGAVRFHRGHSCPLRRFSLCRQQIHTSWTGLARISKARATETVRACSKFVFSVCSPHPSTLSRDSASSEPEDSRVECWLARDVEDADLGLKADQFSGGCGTPGFQIPSQ